MADIYVCGHGGWGVIGRTSIFFGLPSRTQVKIYTEIGHVLYLSEAEDIMTKSADAKQPERVISSFMNCPDLTLYPAPEFTADFTDYAQRGGVKAFIVHRPTKLSQLVKKFAGNTIHWIACGVRELKKA